MVRMVPSHSPGVRAILERVFLICTLMILQTKTSTALMCPVFCDCSPDNGPSRPPWGLKALCTNNDIQEMPVLTPNITSLDLKSANLRYIEGYALAEAPSLILVHVEAPNLISVSKDAFQNLVNLSGVTIISKLSTELQAGLFRNLPSLRTVKVQANLSLIPSEEFCDVSQLETLTLSGNKISSISFNQCVSKAWKNMWELILSDNSLTVLQADDFIHLKDDNLAQLALSKCRIKNLPLGLFQYLQHLTFLDISQNEIESLPPGIFDSLQNLKMLIIGQNYLREIPLSENTPFIPVLQHLNVGGSKHMNVSFNQTFLNATRLRTLMVYHLNLTTIDDSLFANFVNSPVDELNLLGSSIHSISSGAFAPFRFLRQVTLNLNPIRADVIRNASMSLSLQPLQVLLIDDTGLTAIDNETFEGFLPNNTLVSLSLQTNKMRTIGRNSFINFGRVTNLKLSHNSLTNAGLEPGTFNGLDSLEELILDNNWLTVMPERVPLGLPATLRKLSLTQNRLMFLTYEYFQGWQNLTSLYLGNNNIKTLGRKIFYSFKSLSYLDLSRNQVTIIPEDTFRDTVSLKTLLFYDNRLYNVSFKTFENVTSLGELKMHKNSVFGQSARLLETIFQPLRSLRILELLQCGITALPTSTFSANYELDILQLSHNEIVSWEPEVFKSLQNLTILSLANNKITSINDTSFTYLVSIRRLDLSGNPLACTCELLWFKHWINTAEFYLVYYATKNRYTCASPESEKGIALIDFELSEDDCSSHFLFYLIMGLASFLGVVCAVISVAVRFRWYIRYYFFLARSRHRQAQDALFEDGVFQYDVFCCYHNTSRHWVINELLRKLEGEAGIKLCLHDRDWLIGSAIVDNMIESIERSRKTLLLVNNGFARSAWCREETSLAYHRLMETQRNMLTVVLLEDIQQENMDKILRSILSKRVYLKFSQGKRKERKFWKALRAALGKQEHRTAGAEMNRPII